MHTWAVRVAGQTLNQYKEQEMSESIVKQYTRLLILAEAARAVGDFEDYRKIKSLAFDLRLSQALNLN
jgi:hypothetical protein